MKILILTLSSSTYPSKRNKEALRKNWSNHSSKDAELLFFESGVKEELIGDTLYVKIDSSTRSIGRKFLLAIEWCSKNLEFDYIFNTNTSSYVDVENLKKYIIDNLKNKDYVYCGMPLVRDYKDSDEKIKFLSGSGIILNKKIVDFILLNKSSWDHSEWNDVALGKLLNFYQIEHSHGQRQDIKNNFYDNKIDKTQYHIRCRVDNHYGYPRFLEYFILLELFKIFDNTDTNLKNKKFKRSIFELSKYLRIESPRFKLYIFIKKILKKLIPENLYEFLKKRKPNFLKKFLNERF